ncbi:MAG: hypothetical protein KDH96_06475 [Candidatus Riesia sp.]|nr:hypothetical protein [Candidatus Riesia sp.]
MVDYEKILEAKLGNHHYTCLYDAITYKKIPSCNRDCKKFLTNLVVLKNSYSNGNIHEKNKYNSSIENHIYNNVKDIIDSSNIKYKDIPSDYKYLYFSVVNIFSIMYCKKFDIIIDENNYHTKNNIKNTLKITGVSEEEQAEFDRLKEKKFAHLVS